MSRQWAVALVAAVGTCAGVVLWAGGQRTFVTHPVSVLALAVAAVVVSLLARTAGDDVRPFVLALACALAAYLVLGGWATAAPDSVSAGLWSAGWIPVNALLAAIGMTAAGVRRPTVAFLVLSAGIVLGAAFLVRPVAPFEGIATVAPDAWQQTAPQLVNALLVLWNLALLFATGAVFARARRASVVDRRRLARAAAVTSSGPCLVVACLALAVLRDPGDVDPTTGSVAYTCAIALLSVAAAWGVGTHDRAAIRLLAGTWAAALAVVSGVAVVGPVIAQNVAVSVLAVVVTTCVLGAVTVYGLARFEEWSRPPAPRAVARTVPGLSPRENDVLAAVARGATNAAAAADLFLSERTVEQHLRSIFDKLDLGDHGGSNRRVRAAAVWWQHQEADAGTAGGPGVGPTTATG